MSPLLWAVLLAPVQAPAPAAGLRAPALLVQPGEAPPEPLAVTRCSIQAHIDGFLAETTTTLTFRNGLDRPLAGELVFPLPEGAVVTGYGLDVDGEIVDGVPVEKQAARVAFETEARQGVDPGLVEWVKGSNFRTRVFPIPAEGTRTVRVRYVNGLTVRGEADRAAFYPLPLRFHATLPELELSIEVVRSSARPEVRGEGLSGLTFEPWQERWVARASYRDLAPSQDLLIALPAVPAQTVRVEKDASGDHYFVIDDFPPVPASVAVASARRIGMAWDASGSRIQADRARELALLQALLTRLGSVDVELVVFRDVPEPPRTFAVRGGRAEALLEHLRSVPCDGGTALGAVRFPADVAYHLLFSDGLGSLGADLPARPGAPVYALSGDPRADHAVLRAIAEGSGGVYFNLARRADADVVAAIGQPVFSFLSAEAAAGEVADLEPSHPQPVQGRFTLAGRLLAPQARLTVRYGIPGGPSSTRTFELRQSDAAPGLVAASWAQKRVDGLSVLAERHRDDLHALGRRFGIVTPGTSLLVLETLDQHLEHAVEPPATRPEMLAEYRLAVAERDAEKGRTRAEKLEDVVKKWNDRVAWWETEFKFDPSELKKKIAAAARARRTAGLPEGVAARAPPPPPPAPAPPPMPTDETITVEAALPVIAVQSAHSAVTEQVAVTGESPEGPTIAVKPWNPDTPYLRAIERAAPGRAYEAYLDERERFGGSPAFFLDCAGAFYRRGERALARRILTSLLDLELEEPSLLRVAAHKAAQEGQLDLGVDLFEKVRVLRPEEPQSHRDLALVLTARADRRRAQAGAVDREASADYQRALDLLDAVVRGSWDERFEEIELTALLEANRILAVLERHGALEGVTVKLDPRLRRALDLDVRIVLTWDTDETDIDLWVFEPGGESCSYGNPLTLAGGMISNDFTDGYGPEEYLVRRALAGEYRIKAHYFGSSAPMLTGPTTVQATVITHFGRPEEERRSLTLRLSKDTEDDAEVEVGRVRFGRGARRSRAPRRPEAAVPE